MRRRLWGTAAAASLLAAAAVAGGIHAGGSAHDAAAAPVTTRSGAGRPASSESVRAEPCPPYQGLGLLTACVGVRITGPLTLTGQVRTYLPTSGEATRPRTCRDYAKGQPDGYGGLVIGFPDLLDPRKPLFGPDKNGKTITLDLMDDLHGHGTLHGHTVVQNGAIAGYHGPGAYTTYYQGNTRVDANIYNTAYARQVTATVTAAGGGRLLATGMPRLNVNAAGGFLSFAAGPRLNLDVRWTCTGQIPTPAAEAAHGRYRQR